MIQDNRRDYTTLQFDLQSGYDNSKARRRQSCWRHWNRLSSLQRSIICLVLILGVVCGVYVIPTIYHDFAFSEDLDLMNRSRQLGGDAFENKHEPHAPVDPVKKYEKDAIDIIRKKAQNVLQNRKLPEGPSKRGPPSLKDRINDSHAPQVEPPRPLAPDNEVQVNDPEEEQIEKPVNRKPSGPVKVPGPQNTQQEAVVAAFKHAWAAYKKYAWGHDELLSVSKTYSEWFNLGLTLIDSLDTMYLMGLQEEFGEAKHWVETKLDLGVNKDVNMFECTIRVLGGLLSAYHLSNEEIFLTKAKDLGDRLLNGFNPKSGVPYSDVNLRSGNAHPPRWGPDSSTSEATTIQLEFTDLSKVTGNPVYQDRALAVSEHVHSLPKKDGLVPMFINANSGLFRDTSTITLGARADSYYEYLLKMWLQTGKTNNMFKLDFMDAVGGIKKHLMKESEPNKFLYFGELLGGHSFSPKMDHLVCYIGGSLALGAHNGLDPDFMMMGKRIAETCWQMYNQMPTGLSPEIAYFNTIPGNKEDIIVKPADAHNLLRPETVETLFVLYRLTGDKKYRDQGWKIFQSFEKYTKLPEGYTSINNVKSPGNPGYRNKMESFFLGETLKYLYLLFSDDPSFISLDEWVFNTEAHPLPIYSS